ncbi:hypothetical protein [Tardiphaga sp.]|uniref:hypothetical protein n=1 Tax=Tardiphaga sp. TaxID=1926292 RepID=UPI002612D1B8|nr:hypothetical protein [Tardiphaga sp.]
MIAALTAVSREAPAVTGVEPLRQLAAPIGGAQRGDAIMSIVSERYQKRAAARQSPLIHVVWFCLAGLFVSVLLAAYGLDLSPGFF